MGNKDILEIFEKYDTNCTSVGELDNIKISFLQEKCPELVNKINGRTIVMWKDRIEHLKKHIYENPDFSIEKMCSLIPEIIKSPDYIGVKNKDLSIQFIKRYEDNILIAVRMDSKGRLSFRTMYTITESQLSDYLKKDRAWEFSLDN